MSASVLNRTTHPDEKMKDIVHWTLDELSANLPEVGVRIYGKPLGIHHGRFYGCVKEKSPRVWAREDPFPPPVQHLIIGYVPQTPTRCVRKRFVNGPGTYWPRTWQECLVCIVAHEGYHLTECLNPCRTIAWSELMAEWVEHTTWQLWNERRRM